MLGASVADDKTDMKLTLKQTTKANTTQNKKRCKPTHKPKKIAAYCILPDFNQAHPPPYNWPTALLDKNRRNKGIKF